ncbi:MAG: hypothetical protein AAGF99_09070 [Bacteroidota bacterium]
MCLRTVARPLLALGLLAALVTPVGAQPVAVPDSTSGDGTEPASLRPLTARTVAGQAGWQPGVARLLASEPPASRVPDTGPPDPRAPAFSPQNTEVLLVRGRRLTTFYLDGLPVRSIPTLSQAHLDGVRVYTDVAPARYGGATAGLLETTTPTLVTAPFAVGEAFTSHGLDAYGHTLAALSAGSPLLRDRDGQPRLALTLAAELRRFDDGDPRAGSFVRLTDAAQQRLNGAVQHNFDPTGQPVYFPDGLAGQNADMVAAQLGTVSGRPLQAWRTVTGDDAERVDANPFGTAEALWLSGGLHARPTPMTTIRLRGQLTRDECRSADYLSTLYNGASIQQQDTDTWRLHASLDQQVGDRFRLHAAFATERFAATTYDPRFGDDIREALAYGDIDDPRNAVGARYVSLIADPYVQRFSDGAISPGRTGFGSGRDFLGPGATTRTYEHAEAQQQTFRLAGTLNLDRHRVEIGAEGVWATLRGYRWNSATQLARFFDDGNVERGSENAITAYEEIDYDLAGVLFANTYFGYDFLGLNEVDAQDLDALFAGTDPTYAIAPLQPSRFGLYAEDETTLGPLHLRVGVRFDAFDANVHQLVDRFALEPIIRAVSLSDGDVFSENGNLQVRAPDAIPGNIGTDFAVYTDNTGTVVGYRDLGGTFYDVQGTRVNDPEDLLFGLGGSMVRDTRANPASVLTETEVTTAVSPRIEARLTVARDVGARAFYARYAEAPDPVLQGTAVEIRQLLASDTSPSAFGRLDPLRSEAFGLGATVKGYLGTAAVRADLTLFHRRYADLPVVRSIETAFPSEYITLLSEGETSVTGLEAVLSVAHGGFRGAVHYTYQAVEDIDATTLTILATRGVLFPEALGAFGAFQVEDRPHNLHLLSEYRSTPGETVLGQRWLGGLRVAFATRVLSGAEYLRPLTDGADIDEALQRTPILINADLWLEKAFRVGRVEASAYLWIENVLGRANVLEVYTTTGEPDDDGFLASPDGQETLNRLATDLERDALSAHYLAAIQTPYHYGRPRQVRLGLRLGF